MSFVIAIDGPAGAGKSTIAKGVAERLGVTRVDTGAIYRALTLIALERETPDTDVAKLMSDFELRFQGEQVFVGTRDVTKAIRTPRVTEHASRISAIPEVRRQLLALQRRLVATDPGGAVMEGRDIGTVVFPDAELKVFLTASAEERAQRRVRDLEDAGETVSFEEVLAAMLERDRLDSQREVSPLRPADDAIQLDSTKMTIGEVIDRIVDLARNRGLGTGSAPER